MPFSFKMRGFKRKAMSLFRSRSKKVTITQKDPIYKVQYLGNVHTSFMKGDGCVDKALGTLWRCYGKNMNRGTDMEISVCAFGLRARTKGAGLVEYRTHRIPYCIAHPEYPKVFAWVYKHEGKRMRMDLRCHAVVCRSQAVAQAMALKLHENMQQALKDFLREKNQKQRARLILQRTNSAKTLTENESPSSQRTSFLPLRQKLKSSATNFKPSSERLPGAPKLRSIVEGDEPEDNNFNFLAENAIVEEDEEEEMEGMGDSASIAEDDETVDMVPNGDVPASATTDEVDSSWANGAPDMIVGNDIERLKKDSDVQRCLIYGDDNSDSGYSGQTDES